MRTGVMLIKKISNNNNLIKVIKRRNTTSTPSTSSKTPEPNTDEKAAEISKEAWPTLKKYLPVIIPVITITLYTVLVINNEKVKDWTEQYLPSYVDFIRTWHGFDLENLDNNNNIKATIINQMKPVNIVVKFHDGNEECINVNGNESYEKLQHDIFNKYNNDSTHRIINIYFKDDNDDDNNNNDNNSNIDSHILLDNITMKRSLWSNATNTLEDDSKKKQKKANNNHNNHYKNTTTYGNILLSLFKGFNQYLSLTNTKKLTIKNDFAMINIKSLKLKTDTIEKAEYNSTMMILLDQVKLLEWELKNGMKRSIEEIQDDIKKINKEISILRRKSSSLSWFYGF